MKKSKIKWAITIGDQYFSLHDTEDEAKEIRKMILTPSVEPVLWEIKKIRITEI